MINDAWEIIDLNGVNSTWRLKLNNFTSQK